MECIFIKIVCENISEDESVGEDLDTCIDTKVMTIMYHRESTSWCTNLCISPSN